MAAAGGCCSHCPSSLIERAKKRKRESSPHLFYSTITSLSCIFRCYQDRSSSWVVLGAITFPYPLLLPEIEQTHTPVSSWRRKVTGRTLGRRKTGGQLLYEVVGSSRSSTLTSWVVIFHLGEFLDPILCYIIARNRFLVFRPPPPPPATMAVGGGVPKML